MRRLAVAVLGGWVLLPAGALAAEQASPAAPAAYLLPRSGQVSAFDTTGKLIDFQGTGQDGDLQRGQVWPDPRFVANRDGTVSDSLTGLMWLKDTSCLGQLPWPSALQVVEAVNQGKSACEALPASHHDWFLPDVNQLATLLDAQAAVPSEPLRLAGMTGVQAGGYWSATPYVGQMNAWAVDFATGTVSPLSKMERHFLLLARVETPGRTTLPATGLPAVPPLTADAQASSVPASPPARFIQNSDDTVTDTATGLMWLWESPCLPTKTDWQTALTAVQRLNDGGCVSSTGWALPNAVELRSLVDYQHDYPALVSGLTVSSGLGSGVWTSTTTAFDPSRAFAVDFSSGALLPFTKGDRLQTVAVRSLVPLGERPRRTLERGRALSVEDRFVFKGDQEVPTAVQWPPEPRFISNGDGTNLDSLTGLTWLADGTCLGRQSWRDAFETLKKFTHRPGDYKCQGYEAGNVEWELPSLAELAELVNTEEEDSAAWLNKQGLHNVQGSGLYWSATETPLNLYFADAVTIKTGKQGNYPKSLKFHILAKRKADTGDQHEPLPGVSANNLDHTISLSADEPLSLRVHLLSFGSRKPADFWFWYSTPEQKQLWLTPLRTWSDTPIPIHQGPLFNMKDYEVMSNAKNGLAPGTYTFVFAVDTIPNNQLDTPHYQAVITVEIGETGD